MADPLERLTNLVALLLETRQPLTLEAITFRLDGQYPESEQARRAAFERDKAVLRSVGIPLSQTVLQGEDAGRTGYRIERSAYELGDLGLTDEERKALQVAVATVRGRRSTAPTWATNSVPGHGMVSTASAPAPSSATRRSEPPALIIAMRYASVMARTRRNHVAVPASSLFHTTTSGRNDSTRVSAASARAVLITVWP